MPRSTKRKKPAATASPFDRITDLTNPAFSTFEQPGTAPINASTTMSVPMLQALADPSKTIITISDASDYRQGPVIGAVVDTASHAAPYTTNPGSVTRKKVTRLGDLKDGGGVLRARHADLFSDNPHARSSRRASAWVGLPFHRTS
jgi:hypothetical protein